jgi:spermidine synthase
MFFKKYKILNFGRFKLLISPSKKLFSFAGYLDKKKKVFPWYIKQFEREVKSFYLRSLSILGLGMGIGMISHLGNKNWDITYVENDKTMIDIAKRDFKLPKKNKVYNVDVSHFLEKAKERYDVIFYDIFNQNKFEEKFLSLAYLSKIKNLLTPEGILIINVVDYKSNAQKYISKFKKCKITYRTNNYIFSKLRPQNMIIVVEKKNI